MFLETVRLAIVAVKVLLCREEAMRVLVEAVKVFVKAMMELVKSMRGRKRP